MRHLPIHLLAAGLLLSGNASAETITVGRFNYAGPFQITPPAMIDSVDVNAAPFSAEQLLATPFNPQLAEQGEARSLEVLPEVSGHAIHLINFKVDCNRFTKAELKVDGLRNYEVLVDGKKADNLSLSLQPATHSFTIKALSEGGAQPDSLRVTIECDRPGSLAIDNGPDRLLTIDDIVTGDRLGGASLSADGKYLLSRVIHTNPDNGYTSVETRLTETATGRQLACPADVDGWMPTSNLLYRTVQDNGGLRLETISPADATVHTIARNLPTGNFMISPTEDFMVYTKKIDGPAENDADLYEIIHPEDRQPGWRNRNQVMKFDFATGMATPLTFGNRDISMAGMSADGRKLLLQVHETSLDKRPSALCSLVLLDIPTGSCVTLAERQGFINGSLLSPDATKVAVLGSPEAFGGKGRNLPDDRTPSMYDNQIFIIDVASLSVTPMTREFNPSVERMQWSRNDGRLYFTAENRDSVSLYRLSVGGSGLIEPLKAREENVGNFALAAAANTMVYTGQGASNSDRMYTLDTRTMRHRLADDLSARKLAGIRLGKCEPWVFESSRGDSIWCRYVLPPDFDPAKQYPMIVNYYGGCSPTSRSFDSRYPHQLYAANGYVVLVVNPSGCTGFGQEFSSRHVNTAGEGVADDIIEAVTKFAGSHQWVDSSRIGCIGASYGGFMTQYLQTKTDIFSAAISHAGISDHTSYWGEGYWGYSYSEVCMANSYPWSHRDLFVEHSPLYNADKITTPILFLHGDADTNVPPGESIQMYTALKLLGRETAFVAVKGANHQVTEFGKRQKWQETIFAWFAKYLQDNDSWWESLYPAKNLN